MKREKEQRPIIKPFNPKLFWHECRFCGVEFRREQGFIIHEVVCSYCCSECANSVDGVRDMMRNEYKKFLESRPPRPGSGIK